MNAISKMLQNLLHLFCWNHLKWEFKCWLQSNEISMYVQGLVQIFQNEDESLDEVISDVI